MPPSLLPPMRPQPEDQYEQFADVSNTPMMDLLVLLLTMALVLGGGLAGIFALGYFAAGRPQLAWPLTGTLAVLVAVNVGARALRSAVRRR